jgi:hypothetical protein
MKRTSRLVRFGDFGQNRAFSGTTAVGDKICGMNNNLSCLQSFQGDRDFSKGLVKNKIMKI